MQLTENEAADLISSLKTLNVAVWQLVGLIPQRGNGPLLTLLETIVNETDSMVERYSEVID